MHLLALAAALALVGPEPHSPPAPVKEALPVSAPADPLPARLAAAVTAAPPEGNTWGLWGAGALLLGLAGGSWLLARRSKQRPRHIQVIETAALGPKRSLALVIVGRQSLLLSCSEGGVALISSQAATPEQLAGVDAARAGLAPSESTPAAAAFESELAEADDLQRVRFRLAQAQQAAR